jgi:hypothetical protein
MPDLATMVAVAGFAMLATVTNPLYCVVPLGMAVIFSSDPVTASFVGMVVAFLVGSLSKALNIR